jgi:hypothetical protein
MRTIMVSSSFAFCVHMRASAQMPPSARLQIGASRHRHPHARPVIQGAFTSIWPRLGFSRKEHVMLRIFNRSFLRPCALAAAAALAGCAVYEQPRPVYQGPLYQGRPVYQGEAVHVPPGHLPPPGMCRIWFPDRPPGHQPPPGPCRKLQHRVPPGAVLVQG